MAIRPVLFIPNVQIYLENFVTATSKQGPKTTRRSYINVAKNWALTIMLMALAFAHFSSELLLKEQMFIPVEKMLNNTGHFDAKLIDFSKMYQKKSSEISCFLPIVSWRSFPPEISREIGRFF